MRILKVIAIATLFLVTACKPQKHANLEEGLYADIETSKGDILVKLHLDDVPLTVANFVSLAEGNNPKIVDSLKGINFYDGLTFHRVMPNFMIQGGDPLANGTGGPGYKFYDEFPKDSLNKLKYTHSSAGVLSMANSGLNTNGSQFFITHTATPWLDGVHNVFGKVQNEGQAVVDSIAKGDVIKHIAIIRIGDKAKEFDAPKVFEDQFEIAAKSAIEKERLRLEKTTVASKIFAKKMNAAKAKKTDSGLKILTLKKGRGKKFDKTTLTEIHYTISLATGKLIQTTEGKKTFEFTMNKRAMIPGVTEALLQMRQGGKVRLFIPYYLAYGERGGGPFPPKADIVFDLELVKVGK